VLDVTATTIEQHNRFLERVIASGEVWGLTNDEGWCIAPSTQDDVDEEDEEKLRAVLPFWSDRAYAARCAKEEWSSYEPTAIPLEHFLSNWLPLIAENGDLVGTNWNAHLIGAEVEPLELKTEFEGRLEAATPQGMN
jgi:hypothetical protein